MESIDVASDGSCGFWCMLAFFGSCKHAVVRTREELRQIKQKQDAEAAEEMMQAAQRTGRLNRSRKQPPESHKPVCLIDYDLLGQLVWHMNTDNASWEQVRGADSREIAEARRVVPATSVHPQVQGKDYMTTLHLSYFAIKLGMPVFAACEVAQGTRKYTYYMYHAGGHHTDLASESALQTEMDKQPAPVAPLWLPPPLFL